MLNHATATGPALPSAADAIIAGLRSATPFLVLTGAGISAGTGIPTYRDERGRWLRSDPIKHQEFVADPRKRQRYWGRSMLGWPGVRDARPAIAHHALTRLEARGHLTLIVTQNVDRLHQRAGSHEVVDLHGRLDRVRCLDCGANTCREALQIRLEFLNPHLATLGADVRPDGDADLPDETVAGVRVPDCEVCGGTLMPDVVFFGGSVPAERVATARAALERAAALVVVGSSLQVYSGFRFCRWAAQAGKPIFLINPGQTRADSLAQRWPATADDALTLLSNELS
jgi:NAD-dependent SIR2 family protein deacetylase